jgi:hypothetical protein
MDRETSIFYKMTSQNENSTTELLCNLFRIKYFRDICLEYFCIENKFIDEISLENISSQNSTDDSGKPDIVIDTDKFRCYIENKILQNTDLQENQKSNYPENLLKFRETQGKHICYIFLIPKNYEHENEVDEIINKYKDFTRKYYWHEFLSHLYNKELDVESPIIKEGLNYFSELVPTDEPEDTVLNPREVVIMYNPKTINDVLNFVEKIRGTIRNSLEIVKNKMGNNYCLGKEQNNQWGQGYSFKYKNKESIWVGITPTLYEVENGIFVYSVALLEKYLKENIKIDDNEFKHYSDDGYVFIAIDRDLFVEDDKEKILADEIIKILKNVFIKNYVEK